MMGEVLVIGDAGDVGVRAAVAAAGRRVSPGRVRWICGADLAASDWVHTIDGSGFTSTRVKSLDDPLVGSGHGSPRMTWYRATTPAPPRRWTDPRDEAYAVAEFGALLVSWLLQPDARSVNRVDGGSPWGPSWTAAHWRHTALQVGLEVAPRSGATSARLVPGLHGSPSAARSPYRPPDRSPGGPGGGRTVLIVGHRVVNPSTPLQASRCRGLAAAAGCAVLEVAFDACGRMEAAQPLAAVDTAEKVTAVTDYLVEAAA